MKNPKQVNGPFNYFKNKAQKMTKYNIVFGILKIINIYWIFKNNKMNNKIMTGIDINT